MLIIGAVIIGAYLVVSNPTQNTTNPTITIPTQGDQNLAANQQGGLNPNYGDLTPDQIATADIAIGKLLNSSEGITPPMISIVSFEEQEFGNTSLGCPQEGQMYAEVITPGYKVVLEAQGTQYDYRLTNTEDVFLCEQ